MQGGPPGLTLAQVNVIPETLGWFLLTFTTTLAVCVAYLIARMQRTVFRFLSRLKAMGDYRLIRKLGEGGFGEVWLAESPLLKTTVAVKWIRPIRLASGRKERQFLDQFALTKEARLMASLECPHTTKTFHLSVNYDGGLFIVMERLDGHDLEEWTEAETRDTARIARIARQICWSLEEAHGLGLIHGDLKPSNVMLCRYAAREDFVKVLDFGMGYLAGSPEMRAWISPEHRRGTWVYAAPELFEKTGEPSVASDVYAFGCLLYGLLTAHMPFAGVSEEEIRKQHRNPERPTVREFRKDLPDAVADTVDACLSIDPARRPSLKAIADLMAPLARTS
jgi:serine/threonine-protein kinase